MSNDNLKNKKFKQMGGYVELVIGFGAELKKI